MSLLHALYAQQPAATWLAVGALLIVLELATGSGRLFWPALAALAPAALDALHPAPGVPIDVALFAALAALASLAAWRLQRPAALPRLAGLEPSRPEPERNETVVPRRVRPERPAAERPHTKRAPKPKKPSRPARPAYVGLNLGASDLGASGLGDETAAAQPPGDADTPPTLPTAAPLEATAVAALASPATVVHAEPTEPAVSPRLGGARSLRRVESETAPPAEAPPRPVRPPPPPIVQSAPAAPKPPKRSPPAPPPVPVRRATPAPITDPTTMKRLVGRIARSTGDFANGVGRVWIENAEWAADLEHADELLADQPVRVIGVAGALRLRVSPLVVE